MMKYAFLPLLFLMALACKNSTEDMPEQHLYTNDLINETSPYLLQHAHNPVNWKAWNDETLKEAKESEKLMLISIGYAACHWCHVMEKESFEDSTVAAVMNTKFINIKVDREERPDVDQIYIAAVELMTGRAGWPLNVIALPDGRPVWGGTYFPKEDWIQRINRIQELYETEPEKLYDYASRLEEGIKAMDLISFNDEDLDLMQYDRTSLVTKWSTKFDREYGGYQGAPKFMTPNNYDYLLRQAVAEDDTDLMDYVMLTLDKMAFGGLYDHVGGGFARYSTDSRWHVPHFEKMLYDNAQLVSLYSNAYAVTGKPLYKEVVYETIDFVVEELTNDEGAFYSSLDADSETASGELEEGAYYIYTKAELQDQLGSDLALFEDYYNVNDFGKWENDHYVLIRTKEDEDFIKEHNISLEELNKLKASWKETLLNFRNKRPRPRLDDKTLTSWNGLMLKGMTDAYKVFGEQRFLDIATKNADFLLKQQKQSDNRLFHSYKDGKSTINGYLEDYAAVADALISLYEVTLNEKWLDEAKGLSDYAFAKFFDEEKHMFYFTSEDDTELVTRSMEYRDNVIPASNSIMAKNLYRLSHFYELPKYAETAKQMLKNVLPEVEQYPGSFSNWMDMLANYKGDFYEIVVVGPDANEMVNELNQKYIPNKVVAGSTEKSESYLLQGRYVPDATLIYVCVDNTCKLPVRDVNKAIESIK